jgi:hypothetical protein
LDFECPPKAHALKTWLPVCGATGKWWNL